MTARKPEKARVFDRVRLAPDAPYFPGRTGVVAYVGTAGVSVAVDGFEEEYVPLKWSEFTIIEQATL